MGKQIAWNEIDNTAAEILEASDIIWDCAETAFLEIKSMKVLCDLLRKEGFEVEEGIADVPTACKGTFGSGKPVIGFLGEYIMSINTRVMHRPLVIEEERLNFEETEKE